MRKLDSKQQIELCTEVHKRESAHQRLAFYQAEPTYQQFKVKLEIEDIEDLPTDLLRCTVELMVITEETVYRDDDVFYLAEGNTRTSLFKLRTSNDYEENVVKIHGKVDNVEY